MWALRFSVNGTHSENRAFRKRWHDDNNVISMLEFSSNKIRRTEDGKQSRRL